MYCTQRLLSLLLVLGSLGSQAQVQTLDFNSNGIHDLFEFRYLTTEPPSESLDWDGDGRTLEEEALAFTDPYDADSFLEIISWEEQGDSYLFKWSAEEDVVYQLETSIDMVAFDDLGAVTIGTSAGEISVTVPKPVEDATSPVFFRVRVEGAQFPDADADGVPDELEDLIGLDPADGASALAAVSGGDAAYLAAIMNGANSLGGAIFTEETGSISSLNASRFLAQSSMGPTYESIAEVQASGFEGWIDQQMQLPISRLSPYINYLNSRYDDDRADIANGVKLARDFAYFTNGTAPEVQWQNVETAWMRSACFGPDQLRQRTAWALSQVFVVSFNNTIFASYTDGMSDYYDMLLENSFSDYRKILTDVSMHPIMGHYLSHLGNQRADLSIPRLPDENYAREIMQLFSIGLVMLNKDGTVQLDNEGEPIPSYTNDDVTELSKVFTGLWLRGARFGVSSTNRELYDQRMVWHGPFHEYGSKSFLDTYIPSFEEDFTINPVKGLDIAIDALVEHPNCGPFVVRRMIQSLVTSNPSPQYIERVVAVFEEDLDSNGKKDADMGRVIKAILLDEEARGLDWLLNEEYGRVKDPMYRLVSFSRAMDGGHQFENPFPQPAAGNEEEYFEGVQWWVTLPFDEIGQLPLFSPTVFNFYQPDYIRPGILGDRNLYSPELQIFNSVTATTTVNELSNYITDPFHDRDWGGISIFDIDLSFFGNLAGVGDLLVDEMALLLSEGSLSPATRREAIELVNYYPENIPVSIILRIRTDLGLRVVMVAPDTTVQR